MNRIKYIQKVEPYFHININVRNGKVAEVDFSEIVHLYDKVNIRKLCIDIFKQAIKMTRRK
jgi:hypothetical protein